MKTEIEIIALAENKLKAADILFENCFYDDAYYLSGYSLELLLKSKICKTLCIPDFFDFENSKKRRLPVSKVKNNDKENLYKPFKVHDYEQLLILSGLFNEVSNLIGTNKFFRSDWYVVSKWDESVRYSINNNKNDVESFIKSIKNISSWLQQYL